MFTAVEPKKEFALVQDFVTKYFINICEATGNKTGMLGYKPE